MYYSSAGRRLDQHLVNRELMHVNQSLNYRKITISRVGKKVNHKPKFKTLFVLTFLYMVYIIRDN